jgi:hypothetical protein
MKFIEIQTFTVAQPNCSLLFHQALSKWIYIAGELESIRLIAFEKRIQLAFAPDFTQSPISASIILE